MQRLGIPVSVCETAFWRLHSVRPGPAVRAYGLSPRVCVAVVSRTVRFATVRYGYGNPHS
eukprot:2842884-Prymnesium_polylepis.1